MCIRDRPYLPTTKDTINAQTLALCKDGVKILNDARGELVNTCLLYTSIAFPCCVGTKL